MGITMISLIARSNAPAATPQQPTAIVRPATDGFITTMTKHRTFRIVIVGAGRGMGEAISPDADSVIDYSGKKVEASNRRDRTQLPQKNNRMRTTDNQEGVWQRC
jgi:hypothetical protein